ncbi:MAG: hypothetical protein COY04_00585 [Parcubacteria group bacterium CG_4_10_14_0_2_um_filter_7_35_8]|nr:MAG: hypothetical protein COY04_00585 [Parcubacteria group bacterium CG_4_10_14_0_2_um_filter_7_35_8]
MPSADEADSSSSLRLSGAFSWDKCLSGDSSGVPVFGFFSSSAAKFFWDFGILLPGPLDLGVIGGFGIFGIPGSRNSTN